MAETVLPKLRVSGEEAHQQIEEQIEKGQQLHAQQINSDDELTEARRESKKWSRYNEILLTRLFDNASITENDYINFAEHKPRDQVRGGGRFPPSFEAYVGSYRKGMGSSINSLEGIRDRLELYDEPSETSQHTSGNKEVSDTPQPTVGEEVFIVHGHDEAAKHAVARFVDRLDLKPIILDEQPDAGLTIIEKLEREARNVDFAIVLLTPDDVGTLKDEADDQFEPRARQNVILELGYFMGKLDRKKVCLLIKGELENPSDLDGILYASMDNPNEWQLKLAKEMKNAGLPIDLNKLA